MAKLGFKCVGLFYTQPGELLSSRAAAGTSGSFARRSVGTKHLANGHLAYKLKSAFITAACVPARHAAPSLPLRTSTAYHHYRQPNMTAGEHIEIIGAGGHAKAAIGAAQMAGFVVDRAYDDDPAKWGTTVLGVPVEGPIDSVREGGAKRVVIAVGDAALRAVLASRFDLPCATIVHPRAYVHSSASLGPGTIVFAGAVIQPDVRIGAHAIINANATVSYDCIVADFAHLSPGVDLAGEVHIGTGAFLGTGAVVLRGVTVGDWTTVGAGSAVIGDLPNHVLAAGSPARIVRYLAPSLSPPSALIA